MSVTRRASSSSITAATTSWSLAQVLLSSVTRPNSVVLDGAAGSITSVGLLSVLTAGAPSSSIPESSTGQYELGDHRRLADRCGDYEGVENFVIAEDGRPRIGTAHGVNDGAHGVHDAADGDESEL